MKYSIGDHQFKTKKASYTFVKELITELGVCNIDQTHEQYNFMCTLTRVSDPKCFEIVPNPCNCNAYHMNYVDMMDIKHSLSWKKCSQFDFRETSAKNKLNEAMRNAIYDQITDFKNSSIDIPCCVKCQNIVSLQVDHILPFDIIKKEFLSSMDPDWVPLSFDENPMYMNVFKPEHNKFAELWKDHHKKNARLQYLCRSCNIKKSNNITCKDWIKNNKERYNAYHKEYQRKKRQI
jgi:hypothetical protein